MRRHILIGVFVCFILTNCSKDNKELPGSGQEESNLVLSTKELFQTSFLPTFTNYFGRDIGTHTYRGASLAVDWKHEYDEKGRLAKSVMYEKYPSRVLKEISFSDYSADDLSMKVKIKIFTYFLSFPLVDEKFYALELNDDFSLKKLTDEDGSYRTFDELNSQNFVTKLGYVVPDGVKLWTTNYAYDEKGNVTKYTSDYHQYYMTNASVDYTYTDFGDPKSYYFQNEEGLFSKVEYFYREDNTLEKLEEEFKDGEESFGTKIYTYDLNEKYLTRITNFGDGSKNVINYNENEIIIEDFEANGLLSKVDIYKNQEENYFLRMHKEYLNGSIHLIQYFTSNGDLDYTEYYDENGNLAETVYE
ncbi:hypothetical protein C7S20_11890 [Christiangramia fulva]|uniref:Uncharacterized protein n=1 Tax=Christiangramia fulva TaxID=2126553 RepID=A0A2R3Z6J2_9FLAO|nr:hypothetical protein [Christiangramia fulva]AVR45896.1 hypothetical protein C7S20_11890 [Christiangramia fulva]